MDSTIALILVQDGIVNGAIYALLSVAIVLVFAVTRVIFIPQGEFVAFGALTLAMLVNGRVPGTIWLLPLFGAVVLLMELYSGWRARQFTALPKVLLSCVVYPIVAVWAVLMLAPQQLPLWVDVLITLALVVPIGPMLY